MVSSEPAVVSLEIGDAQTPVGEEQKEDEAEEEEEEEEDFGTDVILLHLGNSQKLFH